MEVCTEKRHSMLPPRALFFFIIIILKKYPNHSSNLCHNFTLLSSLTLCENNSGRPKKRYKPCPSTRSVKRKGKLAAVPPCPSLGAQGAHHTPPATPIPTQGTSQPQTQPFPCGTMGWRTLRLVQLPAHHSVKNAQAAAKKKTLTKATPSLLNPRSQMGTDCPKHSLPGALH